MSNTQFATGQPPALIAHFEKFLGPIVEGWTSNADRLRMQFAIARFSVAQFSGVTALTTIGLSNFPLGRAKSGQPIRLELLVMLRGGEKLHLPSVLERVGHEMIRAQQPLLRGHVIGPRGPLWPDSTLEGFFVTEPLYLPEGFASVRLEAGDAMIAWLVPVAHQEARFARAEGGKAFEALLRKLDPDVLDPYRLSIV